MERGLLSDVLVGGLGWLSRIWADGGYSGKLVEEVASLPRHRGVELEIVKRSDSLKEFKVIPKRWIVERTFGWLVRNRRLVRDYEVLTRHSIAMIHISMIKLMLARIAR
jgi:transposase